MRILFLAQRVPYPPDRGDKITTYHEIRHLARKHEVAVACLADGQEDLANVAELSRMVSSVDVVVLSQTRARLRALTPLMGRAPLTVAYFNEKKLHALIKTRGVINKFDVIIAYSSSMAQFAEEFADTPRIIQFADLDSLKWRQYAKTSRS